MGGTYYNVNKTMVEKLLRTKDLYRYHSFDLQKIKIYQYETLGYFVKITLKGWIRYYLIQKLLVRKSFHKWK